MSKLVFASVISEIKQSDIFMTVKARICETPAANLNGARVTEAFIDEIVSNEKRYVGLPLNADVKALTSGNYARLGHLYDARTGEFHSTQIGSFYKFEKEPFDGGYYLVGYARIPKRNKKLSKAITELWSDNSLKFSFELSVGEYEELDDETILIDASENNYLEGTAIVTFPACEDAVALELVAQRADATEGGENEMAEVQKPAEELAEVQPEEVVTDNAEATEIASVEPEIEQAEEITAEEVAEEAVENEAEETAEKKKDCGEEEIAAVVVRESTYEAHTVNAYDQESGKEVNQTVSVSTETVERQDGQIVEATDGLHIAETVIAEPDDVPGDTPVETPEETPEEEVPVTDAVDKKKTAEQMIAELAAVVESLKKEIAEMKEEKKVVAEQKVVGEINPFTTELNANKSYSLLSKATARTEYSLLSKA